MPLLTAPYGEILAAMFGLIVGSFLNVVIHRMPLEQSIVKPRSYCPQCKHPIRWYDNIPLLSYLMLRGKCRDCQQAISIRYLLVEVLTGLVSLQTFLFFNRSPFFYFAYFCLLLAPLLAVIFIDLRHRIIPNAISLPGILVGTAVHYLDAPPGWELRTLLDSVIGILAGGGFLFLVAFAYEKIRKKEGLGGGDVKLAAMLGAFFGWQPVLMILLVASVFGSLVGLLVVFIKKNWQYALPFGPFLSISAYFQLFLGDKLLRWYLGLFH
ncbi:MAG: prepilin peptidase [Deltaproteobacteria bacterium]|nr:prepilin peptidase [Deltaproteobacteria bacterium]